MPRQVDYIRCVPIVLTGFITAMIRCTHLELHLANMSCNCDSSVPLHRNLGVGTPAVSWTPKMSRAERLALIDRHDPALSVTRQCGLMTVSRSSVYRPPAPASDEDLAIMALIDRQYLARPYYGSRRMAAWLATQGHQVNRKRVQRLMRLMGLVAIYQRPNTSKPAAAHKIYPYLLGGIMIERVNQVWCSDVT